MFFGASSTLEQMMAATTGRKPGGSAASSFPFGACGRAGRFPFEASQFEEDAGVTREVVENSFESRGYWPTRK